MKIEFTDKKPFEESLFVILNEYFPEFPSIALKRIYIKDAMKQIWGEIEIHLLPDLIRAIESQDDDCDCDHSVYFQSLKEIRDELPKLSELIKTHILANHQTKKESAN